MSRADDPVVVTPARLREWPLPAPGAGKEARGQVVVVGGSARTPGAVVLAGTAALRAGAGKLVIGTVTSVAAPTGVAVPEAAVLGLPEAEDGELSAQAADALLDHLDGVDAVLLGPGFLAAEAAVALMGALVPGLDRPTVVDALGSAFLTEHPDGLRHLDGRAVLNVNPSELALTAGRPGEEVAADPLPAAREVAARSRVVVLCGGPEKYVATPAGAAWVVQGGGPGLGVSGSGDVQAGVVAGLLARGVEPAQAAVWGAYVHARAGERLSAEVGVVGYLAHEVAAEVPRVLGELGPAAGA